MPLFAFRHYAASIATSIFYAAIADSLLCHAPTLMPLRHAAAAAIMAGAPRYVRRHAADAYAIIRDYADFFALLRLSPPCHITLFSAAAA